MKMRIIAFIALSAGMSGCFTCSQTEFPSVNVVALPPGKELAVQLAGFEATVTTYLPVYGYETMIGSSSGWHRHSYLHAATRLTETYVPQVSQTKAFVNRATETLERCGFTLKTASPAYRVEVQFAGPFSSGGDAVKSAAWFILTAFTAFSDSQTWTAKLKIYDLATGKLVYFRDYSQKYEALVWGPLPLFSPMGSEAIQDDVMQSWCLTALTDLTLADAVVFLSKQAR